MSTKIYNGFFLGREALTLVQIQQRLDAARAVLQAASAETLDRACVRQAVAWADRDLARLRGHQLNCTEGEQKGPGRCLQRAASHVMGEIEDDRRTQRRNALDPTATVALFADDSGLYALFWCEQPEQATRFAQACGASEYNYWNNTDRPRTIRAREWETRQKRWNAFLNPAVRGGDVGASFTLVPAETVYARLRKGPLDDPGFEPPDDWFGVRRQRLFDLALATAAAHAPPEVEEEHRRTRSFAPYMRHHDALRQGQVPAFNDQMAAFDAWLPERYTRQELTMDAAEQAQRWAPAAVPRPGA